MKYLHKVVIYSNVAFRWIKANGVGIISLVVYFVDIVTIRNKNVICTRSYINETKDMSFWS